MPNQIGFWSLLAIVTGSQIGSGIFMLPANLAPFGAFALLGWLISGLGAIALALVFSKLSSLMPKTGGPHVYVEDAFGKIAGFFTGWTYWMVSWVSTTAVVIASVGYLTPLTGSLSSDQTLVLQIILMLAVTGLNLMGVYAAGLVEFFLTILKFIPLLILPLIALVSFDFQNIQVTHNIAEMPTPALISHVVLLTLWGFIGLESGTTPAGSVRNPSKTIPVAVVSGTILVALVYLFNSLAIMGSLPASELAVSKAPFADAAQHVLGGQWYLAMSLIASILCLGTLNAWTLASSQIALGLANDGLAPNIMGKTNRKGAPKAALAISSVGISILLILTANPSLAQQLTLIIDFSVTAFLFVYVASTLAFLKKAAGLWQWSYGLIALCFCAWILGETSLHTLGLASLFIFSGLPVWFYVRRTKPSLPV